MGGSAAVPVEQVDAVMLAARGLVAVIATSLAAVEDRVTLPQLRVLVLADGETPLTLARVAAELQVHASNATRICDRLVQARLLDRQDNPADRRQVHLTLTRPGRDLLVEVIDHRRRSLTAVLGQLRPAERVAVAGALRLFGDVALQTSDTRSAPLAWA